MPSTVVHLALAGLIAAALLGAAFDRRALLVAFAATALPDLDAFVALVSTVGHRAALHTLLLPLLGAVLLWADCRLRRLGPVRALDRRLRESGVSERIEALLGVAPRIATESLVRRRWGDRGVRVAWVSLLCLAVAGIALDFTNGVVNPFWPVYDQFYRIDGKVLLSSRRGLVQTFVDLGAESDSPTRSFGTTADVALDTGVAPRQPDDEPVDRVFPVVRGTWELLLLVVGAGVTAARFRVDSRPGEERDD